MLDASLTKLIKTIAIKGDRVMSDLAAPYASEQPFAYYRLDDVIGRVNLETGIDDGLSNARISSSEIQMSCSSDGAMLYARSNSSPATLYRIVLGDTTAPFAARAMAEERQEREARNLTLDPSGGFVALDSMLMDNSLKPLEPLAGIVVASGRSWPVLIAVKGDTVTAYSSNTFKPMGSLKLEYVDPKDQRTREATVGKPYAMVLAPQTSGAKVKLLSGPKASAIAQNTFRFTPQASDIGATSISFSVSQGGVEKIISAPILITRPRIDLPHLVAAPTLSSDGKFAFVASRDMYSGGRGDLATMTLINLEKADAGVTIAAVSATRLVAIGPTNAFIVPGDADVVIVYDRATFREIRRINFTKPPRQLEVIGKTLLVGIESRTEAFAEATGAPVESPIFAVTQGPAFYGQMEQQNILNFGDSVLIQDALYSADLKLCRDSSPA